VENAVRHGIARRTDAGRLIVTSRRASDTSRRAGDTSRRDGGVLELSVEDDGAGLRDVALPLPGHGIENTRERLRTLYGDRATLVVGPAAQQGTIAVLRLPYRELVPENRTDGRT
jgi:LytS/YehU family sensor histidine kinase